MNEIRILDNGFIVIRRNGKNLFSKHFTEFNKDSYITKELKIILNAVIKKLNEVQQ